MSATCGLALRITRGLPQITFAICLHRSTPEDAECHRSTITAKNGLCRSISRVAPPFGTTSTSYPSEEKSQCRIFRKALSSSSTKIRSIVTDRSSDSGGFKVAAKVVVAIAFPHSARRSAQLQRGRALLLWFGDETRFSIVVHLRTASE